MKKLESDHGSTIIVQFLHDDVITDGHVDRILTYNIRIIYQGYILNTESYDIGRSPQSLCDMWSIYL